MNDFAALLHTHPLTWIDASKNGGQPVILVLRPAVERMSVAIGTSLSNSQQRFGNIFRLATSVTGQPIECGGPDGV